MEQNPTGQGDQQPSATQPTAGPEQKKSSNKILLIIIAVVVVLGVVALVGGYFVMRSRQIENFGKSRSKDRGKYAGKSD